MLHRSATRAIALSREARLMRGFAESRLNLDHAQTKGAFRWLVLYGGVLPHAYFSTRLQRDVGCVSALRYRDVLRLHVLIAVRVGER